MAQGRVPKPRPSERGSALPRAKDRAPEPLGPPDRPARIGVVAKRSALQVHVEERQDPELIRLIEQDDASVAALCASHEAHQGAVREVTEAIADLGAELMFTLRAGEPFDEEGLDLVITVGGDGTLLGASHFVDRPPILAINSAPSHSVGFFCGAKSGAARQAIQAALRGTLRRTVLTRMQVKVNAVLLAGRVLNDALFCHASPAATSRYVARLGDVEEQQKSSGFWIGPAAGSTAAQRSAGGRVLPLTSRQLQLVVREPYTPHNEQYELRHALIPPGKALVVRSKMHDAKLFLDGPDTEFEVHFGDEIEFAEATRPLSVLGISSRRKWR
jgi:NAD+ kinase